MRFPFALSLLLSLFFISTKSIAQDSRFGAKVGLNLASLGTEYENEVNSFYTGYAVGFAYSMDLEQFGIQVDGLFSRRGGQVAIPGTTIVEYYNYIDIPIALKWYTGKGFNVHGGPYFSIFLNATREETVNGQLSVLNLDEFTNWADYGFFLGVAYDLEMGLTFEIRYNYGLVDVDSQANIERRHRFAQISAYYFF